MKTILALATLALAAGVTSAQDAKPAPSPDKPVVATPVTQTPAEPPKPTPVPVPDGPVLKKAELEGGLILEDLKFGDGYEIQPGGAVYMYYHGTLKDGGKVFDSTFDRGQPVAYPLARLIPGWQKGVPGMKVGGVRRLTIPAALAWGDKGAGADIPPNADVVFVIQIVDAIQVYDEKVGDGEAASTQCVAVTRHVIKDKDGKEIEKTPDGQLSIWFPQELQGFDYGIDGMKVGGKRRIVIPKEFNPVFNRQGTTPVRPQNEPLEISFELVTVRNIFPSKPH